MKSNSTPADMVDGKSVKASASKLTTPTGPGCRWPLPVWWKNSLKSGPSGCAWPGGADQPLFAEVEIVPRKDLPFTISRIKAKSGDFIKYEWIERCTDGHSRCVLRVENTRKEKGRYVDALYISTDSNLRSVIPIYVIGMIQ